MEPILYGRESSSFRVGSPQREDPSNRNQAHAGKGNSIGIQLSASYPDLSKTFPGFPIYTHFGALATCPAKCILEKDKRPDLCRVNDRGGGCAMQVFCERLEVLGPIYRLLG